MLYFAKVNKIVQTQICGQSFFRKTYKKCVMGFPYNFSSNVMCHLCVCQK